jgi:hexosaminidase
MKCISSLFFSIILNLSIAQISPIIPAPVVYKELNESLNFDGDLLVNFIGLSTNLQEQITHLATIYHGIQFSNFTSGPKLSFKKLENVIQDSYSINVSNEIVISFSSDASCYYAFISLMQLIENTSTGFQLKKCFVKDYPKFSWRGLHLDVSRHFFTVDEVKKYIDLMSLYKFNTFHWHLTDDQGWRIEIKSFPKLTEIGGWRDSTMNNHYSTKPRTYTRQKYGGYYTQEQIKEVVAYANSKFVTIVPEIEMPGHSRAALAAYPEYSCTGIQQGVEGLWGVFDDIFCSKEETILFLQKILDEVILLFPGKYIHIGGDEAPKTRWEKCTSCQKVMNENHLKNEHQLQSYFIQRMDKYLTEKGRKLIGWDEILEGGLSSNAAVMSWRGFEGGMEAASQEHEVVMSPGSHCYFDHYQGKGSSEPIAIGGFTPLEKVYEFNPIPNQLNKKYEPYILGGQANLWTEYIADFEKVQYMVYPRALALIQSLWCLEKPSFDEFKNVLIDKHLPFLKKMNVHYSKSIFSPKIEWKRTKKGVQFTIKSNQQGESYEVQSSEIRNNKISKMNFNVLQDECIEIDRSEKDQINYTYGVRSKNDSSTTQFNIQATNSLGIPVKYITQPSASYNSGNLTLVDGQHGSLPWKRNEWIGFDTTEIEIEIDLLKKQKYNQLNVSFLSDEHSWIHFPERIEVFYLHKGKWKHCSRPVQFSYLQSEQVRSFQIELNKPTRNVLLKIKSLTSIPIGFPGAGHIPWTFIDEIEVVK